MPLPNETLHNEKKQEEEDSSAELGSILNMIGDVGGVYSYSGISLTKPLHYFSGIADLGGKVLTHPGKSSVEKMVCGTAVTMIKEGIDLAVAGVSANFAGLAASTVITPVGGFVVRILVGGAVHHVTDKVIEPLAHKVTDKCHQYFEILTPFLSPSPISVQQQAAQELGTHSLSSTNLNYPNSFSAKLVNSFAGKTTSPWETKLNKGINDFFARDCWNFSLKDKSASTKAEVNKANSILYLNAMKRLGLGYVMSLSGFRAVAASTNLLSSFNRGNPFFKFPYFSQKKAEIGGVGGDVALISDLINCEAHAQANDYFLCFQEDDFPKETTLIQPVAEELARAFFLHRTLPLFSLHFNNEGFLYPVVNPAFSLISEIMGFLDYWMKCYINGGIFDENFLRQWQKNKNINDDFLRANLIDLKNYCQANNLSFKYLSLRELQSHYGLQEDTRPSKYQQPFMTSFRIISYQKKFEREGNILIAYPSFRIEYSIDMMPDYKNYIDNYYQQHGHYPEEHQKTIHCYELFAEEIKSNLPQLPICRDLFKLLGLINALSYFYVTLDKMGKEPEFNALVQCAVNPFPSALPPIPVRYFRSFSFTYTYSELVKPIIDKKGPLLDEELLIALKKKPLFDLPLTLKNEITSGIKQLISLKIKEWLPLGNEVVNDDELLRISAEASSLLVKTVNQITNIWQQNLQNFLEKNVSKELGQQLALNGRLPLVENIELVSTKLIHYFAESETNWQASPKLVISEIYRKTPEILHKIISQNFKEIGDKLQHVQQEITVAIAKLEQQKIIDIEQNCQQIESAIKRQLAEQINPAIQKVEELRQFMRGDRYANVPAIEKIIEQINNNIQSAQQQAQGLITANQDQVTKAISSDVQGRIASLENLRVQLANDYYCTEGLRVLREIKKRVMHHLEDVRSKIENFSSTFLKLQTVADKPIKSKYTHSFLSFTHPDLSKKTGDNFQIIGGCGMELPTLSAEPLAVGNQFAAALVNDDFQHPNHYGQFKVNDKCYRAICLETKAIAARPRDLLEKAPETGENLHYLAMLADKPELQSLLSNEKWLQKDAWGCTLLHAAAFAGNTETIALLVQTKPTLLKEMNVRGETPFITAIQANNYAAVALLLELGANANEVLPNGLFPLYLAIDNFFIAIAELLLEQVINLDVNRQLDNGMTALHKAVEYQQVSIVRKIIAHGGSINCRRKADGYTPVHSAAKVGNLLVLQALLLDKTCLNVVNDAGKNVLHIAVEEGHTALVEFLLHQATIEVDKKTFLGRTALMMAINQYHPEMAEILAEKSAINITNDEGDSTAMIAISRGMPTIADILWRRGENPLIQNKQGYDVPYYLARTGDLHRLCALIEKQGSILQRRYVEGNLLLVAVQSGHFLIVEELLAKGLTLAFPINNDMLVRNALIQDEIGFFLEFFSEKIPSLSQQKIKEYIHLAAEYASIRCFHFLMKHHKKDTAEKLLFSALIGKEKAIIKSLLEKINDVTISLDEKGNSALHLLAKFGLLNCLKYLVKRGADATQKNRAGDTVFAVAIHKNDDLFLKQLFKRFPKEQWPEKISPGSASLSREIKAILLKYKKLENDTRNNPSDNPENTGKEWKEFLHLLQAENFRAAADFMQSNKHLIKQLRTQEGAKLFQALFFAMHDYQDLHRELAQDNLLLRELDPSPLLQFLQKEAVNPSIFLGKNNPLMAMVFAGSDEDACYRFKLYHQYFPQSALLHCNDKLGSQSFSELALRQQRPQLFTIMDALRKGQQDYFALHEAVTANQYDMVLQLINQHAADKANDDQQTPLMLAAARGNLRIIKLLLQQGANTKREDRLGRNALHYALQGRQEEAALMLLPLSPLSRCDREYNTPLLLAADYGFLAVVRYLCTQLAAAEKERNRHGHNALHRAAIFGHVKLVEFLISDGFDVNAKEEPECAKQKKKCLQRTPLHLAGLAGHADTVLSLLALGADYRQKDVNGYGFYEYAILSKNEEIRTIIRHSPHFYEPAQNHWLLQAAATVDDVVMINELLLANVNLNTSNRQGQTALHIAAINNSGRVCQRLLAAQVMTDCADLLGNTPLHYAAQQGQVYPLQLLLDYQASINKKNEAAETPLFKACLKGQTAAVITLLARKADYSLTNKNGLTPLHIALQKGHYPIVTRLIAAGDKSYERIIIQSLANPFAELVQRAYENYQKNTGNQARYVGNYIIHHGLYRQPSRPKETPKNTIPSSKLS